MRCRFRRDEVVDRLRQLRAAGDEYYVLRLHCAHIVRISTLSLLAPLLLSQFRLSVRPSVCPSATLVFHA